MNKRILKYVEEKIADLYALHYELCHIPAPSHHEEKRAQYCKEWFCRFGMTAAYIDRAQNVILPYKADEAEKLTVFVAHTDTVFSDTQPMPYLDDGERIHCPGAGDDTGNLAVLMMVARFFHENNIACPGILFVANSCEEGLGNLKGTRQLFADFGSRIKQFISFDSTSFHSAADRCVGSHRYEVTVKTEGGHSWGRFGNKNAIAELAGIIQKIYSITLPEKEGKKVTYNVGRICGGTSVNTIAQEASALLEYRSDDEELLAFMKAEFAKIFDEARSGDVTVDVQIIGERPCAGDVDLGKIEELKAIANAVVLEVTGKPVEFGASSTDCNIPLSLGIPALCIGTVTGAGAHTRQEWVEKASFVKGLEIGIKAALRFAAH